MNRFWLNNQRVLFGMKIFEPVLLIVEALLQKRSNSNNYDI